MVDFLFHIITSCVKYSTKTKLITIIITMVTAFRKTKQHTHKHIYIYIYSSSLIEYTIKSWTTIVQDDTKIHFSIASTPRFRREPLSFTWIAPFTLNLYPIMR